MRRLVYIVMLLLIQMSITNVFAGERSKEAMRMAALKALSKSNNARKKAATTKASDLKEYVTLEKLSIIGNEALGFAVITNDDRFDEVIGYSFTKFSKEMPCGFKWWMETANRSMEMAKGQVPVKAQARNTIRKAGVSPLITTKWGQDKPYNNKCKVTVDGKDYSLLTGCVATAMAQIMNYYKYPTKGKGENSYTINYSDWGEQTYYANFEISYYDWDNMLDDYSDYFYLKPEDKYTDAVSKLMSDCGKAVNMIYRTYLSTAYSFYIPIGLQKYFSFLDETTTIYDRNNYSNNEDWMNLVYNALNNHHPILYRGDNNSKNGHMFLIHGYEPDGKVIVNWGWNGYCDGSFMIDMLTPGTFGGDSFNDN